MMRKDAKSRDYAGGCPSFEDIMAWVEEEFSDEGCVLHEIGWIDEDGNMMEDTVHADLATLNEGVQAGLSEAEEHGHCFDQYDAEQTAILEDLGVKITGFKCFM